VQAKSQVLPPPQVQSPLAQSPLHSGLLAAQLRWHGGAPHGISQLASGSHVHVPFAQTMVSSSHAASSNSAPASRDAVRGMVGLTARA
jgi:hypothetical protein